MAYRPATQIVDQDTPPPRSYSTDTGVWYTVGLSQKGPTKPRMLQSLNEFVKYFGDRQSYSVIYDSLELYFREGGARAYFARVVGPAAVASSHTFKDAGNSDTVTISAIGPGDWGDSLNVEILAPLVAGFRVKVSHDTEGDLETSPDLADKDALFDWIKFSSYITAEDESSQDNPAVVAVQNLAGGDDDRDNITDDEWDAALALLRADFGPGQVSAPGRTTDAGHQALIAHAKERNRLACLDAPDTNTYATLEDSAANAPGSYSTDGRWGRMDWPWVKIKGPAAGTYRAVPPCALVAAKIARNDGLGMSPNQPAAGRWGEATYVNALTRPAAGESEPDLVDRDTLNSSGVNVIRAMFGGEVIRIYGWRTLTDPVTDPDWINFGNSRLRMAIHAEAENILEEFMFAMLDGRGFTFGDLKGALTGMLIGHYNQGDLWGETADKAFYVDVGAQVNTPETLAANEVHAIISLRMSPFAEFIQLVLVKRPITEAVV